MIDRLPTKTIRGIRIICSLSITPLTVGYISARRMVFYAKRMTDRLAIKTMRAVLAKYGYTITPLVFGYISARRTVGAAMRRELSVCDYVEKLWNHQGETQRVISKLASYGAFNLENPNILEIGTGTGRYLEKVLKKCKPAKYESYEPNYGWSKWLQSTYPIISHKADGVSLRQTYADSVDLLHAHGVFVYLPFLVVYQYFKEIFRVVKNNGFVIFDIISEDCLDQSIVEKWLRSPYRYPCFLSTKYVISLFESHGFVLLGSFRACVDAGYAKYIVFKRDKTDEHGATPDCYSGDAI